jgi:hypothetical protein
MAGNGVPGPGNPFGFGMPQPAAAAAGVPNPAEQEGFNPPRPFLDPIQDWRAQHKDALRDRGIVENDPPTSEKIRLTTTQVVVLGLLKRVTDLERQTDNLDRAIMQMRNPNARGGRRTYRRTRRHMHTI